jgi:3-phenylpropionate/cinnamic acid dioxygenase small subunit
MIASSQGDEAALAGLKALAAHNEIAGLVNHLGRWLDEDLLADPHAMFTLDVSVQTPGGSVQGIDLVAAQARRTHSSEQRTQHFITNLLIELHGDLATVRSNLFITFTDRATSNDPRFMGGDQRFEVVWTPQGWRISRMEITPVWRSGPWQRQPDA